MQEAEIVPGFLFPADQQAAGAVGPRVGALDDPAPRFGLAAMRTLGGFPFARNVCDVPPTRGQAADRLRVVPFVQAQVLAAAKFGPRTANGNALERFLDQLLIMHIGAGDRDADRHAAAIGERRAFDAQFAAIGRVFPRLFPPRAALWSWRRRDFAIAIRCRRVRHTPPVPAARPWRRRRARPTLESTNESRCRNRTPSAWPSTDTPSAGHTECQPRPFAAPAGRGRLCNSSCKPGAPVESVAIKLRGFGETMTHNSPP